MISGCNTSKRIKKKTQTKLFVDFWDVYDFVSLKKKVFLLTISIGILLEPDSPQGDVCP